MNKFIRIIGILFIAFLFYVAGLYMYITDFGYRDVIFGGPRKPNREIPVTYNIGWWAYQNALNVERFQIGIVENRLIFNSKSLIYYKVSGYLTYKDRWQTAISHVHISERINLDTSLHCDRIIEITPVVEAFLNEKVKSGFVKFAFKNEHMITSNHYGINRIKFICGDKEQMIELHQGK